MGISDFIDEVREYHHRYGYSGLKYNAQDFWHGILSRFGFWFNYGENVYEREWDLLIVLDACRWDLMEEVADEYEWIKTSESTISTASHSREWLHKTFMQPANKIGEFLSWVRMLKDPEDPATFEKYWVTNGDVTNETAYITWNMFADMLNPEKFHSYVPLGRAKWNDEKYVLDPRQITDNTIEVMRNENPEYTIAHYMQPHTPFRSDEQRDKLGGSVWERIQRGEKNQEKAWEEYKDNLRWVLDDVELLLENVDAEKVVITADHGNAIGEWGCYGHRPYVPINAVKRVPWIETTATDLGTHEPEIKEKSEINEDLVEKRLKALGYK